MTKVTLQITGKDTSDKTVTEKIAYINPETSDTLLSEFARKLAALTNNTTTNVKKITEEDIG